MSEKAERRKAVAELRKAKLRRDLFIRDMLARPDGREFIWWLLQIGKFGTQPFAVDSHSTAFGCGELNVGQQIFAAVIEADPAGFLRMQQEINDVRSNSLPDAGAGSDPHADSRARADTVPDSDSDPGNEADGPAEGA